MSNDFASRSPGTKGLTPAVWNWALPPTTVSIRYCSPGSSGSSLNTAITSCWFADVSADTNARCSTASPCSTKTSSTTPSMPANTSRRSTGSSVPSP